MWSSSTIRSILRNEKYKGDALLQKTFTVDFLTKTKKKNEGKVTQYYIEGHHEAIIDPLIWQAIQTELERRQNGRSSQHPFASRIQCEDCGDGLGRKPGTPEVATANGSGGAMTSTRLAPLHAPPGMSPRRRSSKPSSRPSPSSPRHHPRTSSTSYSNRPAGLTNQLLRRPKQSSA